MFHRMSRFVYSERFVHKIIQSMKKRHLLKRHLLKCHLLGLSALFSLMLSVSASAQNAIPVQVFAGDKNIQHDFFFGRNLDSAGRVSFFNFTQFAVDYSNTLNSSYTVYSNIEYNLNTNWGLAAGGYKRANFFTPFVAVSYELFADNFYLNLFPTVELAQIFTAESATRRIGYELFGFMVFNPPFNSTWGFFSQMIFGFNFNSGTHNFSYQQVRLGLDWIGKGQFGLGVDFGQVGQAWQRTTNIGVFIRKEL
jgi:hypothetical protein